jgi:D-alanine transaminase
MQLAMIQDKIMPLADVDKAYLDRGIFFGDGVYEVVRSYNGRIFDLADHIARFKRSLAEVDIIGVDIDNVR